MFSLLFFSVLTLFCFLIPGFLLKKFNIANDSFAKNMSVYTLYVAQPSMVLHGFFLPFDLEVFKRICVVFVIAFFAHLLFYFISLTMFKNAPQNIKSVLRFGIIFSNAGYMGIPIINDVLGDEYTVYATTYIVCFNIFLYSIGRLVYTNDKKYISIKPMILNLAVIPIIIGLIIYVLGIGGWIAEASQKSGFIPESVNVVYNVITVLKTTVAPASMMVIGAKLADTSFKGLYKDKYVYLFTVTRLFFFPAMVWGALKILNIIGILPDDIMTVMLILSSTPAATATTMFAEIYGADSAYSGKLVALTTILSVITIPTVALLLYI